MFNGMFKKNDTKILISIRISSLSTKITPQSDLNKSHSTAFTCTHFILSNAFHETINMSKWKYSIMMTTDANVRNAQFAAQFRLIL